MKYETLEQAGYRYGGFSPEFGLHLLIHNATGAREFWAAAKHTAGYGLVYKNTHLEFVTGGAVDYNGKPVHKGAA